MTSPPAVSLRVFVNAHGIDVRPGSSALDCIRAWRADEADAISAGERLITDSRGLPIAPDAPASAGSIFRTVAKRASAPGAPGE